jgi:hypothetical protein
MLRALQISLVSGFALLPNERVWLVNGEFQSGMATHYGPFPGFPPYSEIGYQPMDVGVGCSNGQPGGDPKWLEVLGNGVRSNPLLNSTVWPMAPTVAVSAAAWSKKVICWQSLQIRNKNNPSLVISARVVDFCPKEGCHWSPNSRHFNVDIYGQDTWEKLGGGLTDGQLEVEVSWPSGLVPYVNSSEKFSLALTFSCLLLFSIIS